MNDCQFYALLQELRCVAVREVAERLGISRKSARNRLERLTKIGAMRKKKIGRAVLYCFNEIPLAAGYARKMRARAAQVVELLARTGCAATSVLTRELGLSHTQAFYALRLLQAQGCAVEVALGRVAVWCISYTAATKLIEELRETVARLVSLHRLRYVTPRRLYELIARDAKARETFSRIINVGRPSAAMFGVLKALLNAVYGDPVVKSVFYVAQPAANADIDIREVDVQIVDGETANVKFRLSPEEAQQLRRYAERRRTSVSAGVRRAVEQLLTRHR